MTRFHTDEYVDFLNRVTPDTAMDMTGGGARCQYSYLIPCRPRTDPALVLAGDDNPAFDGVFEFSSISAGGTICAF